MNKIAAALTLSLLLSGCGSTVNLPDRSSDTSARQGVDGAGLSAPAAGSSEPPATTATSPGGVASVGNGVGTGGAGSTGRTSGSSPVGSNGLPVGVTAKAINVGIPYNPSAGQQLSAIGFGALAGGDSKQYFDLVISDANAHGGILGHRLNPIYDTVSNDPNETQAQGDQSDCAYLTQDHKVFATFLDGGDDTSRNCLSHGGVSVMLTENLTTSTSTVFDKYPNYVELSTLDYDHTARPWVDSLVRQHYFDAWDPTTGTAATGHAVKIGVITSDQPDIRRATQQTLLPALARAGHPVDPNLVAYITFPQTTNDDASAVNDVQAAELKFFQSGVTHVVINDYAGGFTAFFTRDADNQRYHPRYGLSTQSGAEALQQEGLIPAGQLNGAIGFGWDPALDLRAADDPDNGPYSNSTRRRCLALFARGGVSFSSPTAEAQALAICDMVWSLRAILSAGGPTLTADSYAIGIGRVGRSFTAASTMGTYLAPTHRGGVGVAADWSYVASCTCMRYVSRPYQVD